MKESKQVEEKNRYEPRSFDEKVKGATAWAAFTAHFKHGVALCWGG